MRLVAVVLSASLLAPAPDSASAAATAGTISRVTVHPDRAEVTRTLEVRVPVGRSDVRFSRLPQELDADSITVGARGVRAVIGTVELRTDPAEEPAGPQLAEAEAELRRIEGETARLAAEEGTDVELRKYLDALRDAAARAPAEAHLAVDPNPAAMERMLAFLRGAHSEIATRDVARQAARAALADRLRAAQARRDAALPGPSEDVRSAVIDVEAFEAGVLRVELSYVVTGASWRPAYRATLDPDAATVQLVSEAVVAQLTGEDWSDVALTLSTSAPDAGLEPPVLLSWMLVPDAGTSPVQGRTAGMPLDRRLANDVVSGALAFPLPAASIQSFKLITSGAAARYGEQSTSVANAVMTSLISTGYDVSYVVPGLSDVASDGAEHRVTLRSDALPAKLSYRIVPALSQEAHAMAETTAPADRPLLAGPVRVFASGTLLGAFDLPETAPGDDLRFPFGADRRVKVTRIMLPHVRSERAGAKERQVRAAYRTTIENRRDVAINVTLEERLPVSQDERIAVKLGEATTDGSAEEEGRPGILAWKFSLQAHESNDVSLEYIVRHPREVVLAGL